MLDELNQSLQFIMAATQHNLQALLYILAVYGLSFAMCWLFPPLLLLGIIPRQLSGLRGIIFAPFLHAGFNHLFFNMIPLLVLSNFILLQGMHYYLLISAEITVISGLGIWCFGKSGIHLGASALITGYWSFLLANAYQQQSTTTIILALVSIYYFAGIFFGIFPSKKGVSWEGHLFGLLAGLLVNFL